MNTYGLQLEIFPELAEERLDRLRQINETDVDEDSENEDDKLNFFRELKKTPHIPDFVYNYLPEPLKTACKKFRNKRERDVFLTAAIIVISGIVAKVEGKYDGKIVYSPLFCFIVAPPANDKNAIVFAKALGDAIHQHLLNIYKANYRLYLQNKKESKTDEASKATVPPPKMKIFYIPANSSAASVISHLDQSDGIGAIVETEADTMGYTMKQDWGGYSDACRKSFHNEKISYSRKKDSEFIEVNTPRLAIALAGTPSQVTGIIKSAADGLFSRFIFYSFSLPQEWRDVSANRKNDLTTYFNDLGQSMLSMYKMLEIQNYKFDLEDKHWRLLNDRFSSLLKETDKLTGSEAPSTVKRLGLITYRIAMVLSVLRAFENGIPEEFIICSDDDFANAFTISQIYFQHSLLMFESLKNSNGVESKSSLGITRFLNAVKRNKIYKRSQLQDTGKQLGLSERTIDGYIRKLVDQNLLKSERYGEYYKPIIR